MKTFHLQLTIILLFALMFTISCADNEVDVEQTKNSFEVCNIEGMAEDALLSCTNETIDTSLYCELVSIEDIFELTVEERKWMPYYCMDINDRIYFVDSLGNETYFVLLHKSRNVVPRIGHGIDNCIESESKTRFYCVYYESILTNIYSELLDQELFLYLDVDFPIPFRPTLETRVSLEIRGNNTKHLLAYVEKRNFSYIPAGNIKFYDEIKLLGEKFYNVHNLTNTWQSSFIPMYYNKEFGIVGFRDKTNKLWKVKR